MKFGIVMLFVSGIIVSEVGGGGDVTKRIQLLPAQNLDQFTIFVRGEDAAKGPSKVITLQDGMVKISGQKSGYIATKESFSNYRLIAEYKWEKEMPGNDSGIFIHATTLDKGAVRAFEVNLLNGAKNAYSGEVWILDGPRAKLTVNGAVKSKGGIPTKDRKNHEKAAGEWNTMEIVCDGGKVQIKVNGNITLEGTDAEPKAGKICLQSNKGGIVFRRLELLPLK